MNNGRGNNSALLETMMSLFEESVYEDHLVDLDLSTMYVEGKWVYSDWFTNTAYMIFISGVERGVHDSRLLLLEMPSLVDEYTISNDVVNKYISKVGRVVPPVESL